MVPHPNHLLPGGSSSEPANKK
jgi:hypothetical protein